MRFRLHAPVRPEHNAKLMKNVIRGAINTEKNKSNLLNNIFLRNPPTSLTNKNHSHTEQRVLPCSRSFSVVNRGGGSESRRG